MSSMEVERTVGNRAPPQGGAGRGRGRGRCVTATLKAENACSPGNIHVNQPQVGEMTSQSPLKEEHAPSPVNINAPEVEDMTNEEVYGKLCGILNKLTPENFPTLVEEVLRLPIQTGERLNGSVTILLEKAVNEQIYSKTYANLAKHLSKIRVPPNAAPNLQLSFRALLLDKCQREFSETKPDYVHKPKQTTDQEITSKSKRRALGNTRFIGELFKVQMLNETIMHQCIMKLLKRSDDEASLERLCLLLTTIGKDIDRNQSQDLFNVYFTRLKRLVDLKKLSTRIRFMILDVIDLRKNNWIPRKEKANPKTIEQIHREAEQETLEKRLALQKFEQEQRSRKWHSQRQS